jgi:hypothetical protein
MKGETRESFAKDAILNYLDVKKIYVSIETIEMNTGVSAKKIHSLVLKMEKRKHVKVEMYEQWRVIILPAGTQFLKNGGYTRNEAQPRLISFSRSAWFIGPICFLLGILVSGLYVSLNKNSAGPLQKQSYHGTVDSSDYHPKTIKKKHT